VASPGRRSSRHTDRLDDPEGPPALVVEDLRSDRHPTHVDVAHSSSSLPASLGLERGGRPIDRLTNCMDRLAPEISGSSAEDIQRPRVKGGRARGVQTEPEHARRPRSWEQHDRLHRMLRLGPDIAKAFRQLAEGRHDPATADGRYGADRCGICPDRPLAPPAEVP